MRLNLNGLSPLCSDFIEWLVRPNNYSTIPLNYLAPVSPPERLPDVAPVLGENYSFDLRGESAKDDHKCLKYVQSFFCVSGVFKLGCVTARHNAKKSS